MVPIEDSTWPHCACDIPSCPYSLANPDPLYLNFPALIRCNVCPDCGMWPLLTANQCGLADHHDHHTCLNPDGCPQDPPGGPGGPILSQACIALVESLDGTVGFEQDQNGDKGAGIAVIKPNKPVIEGAQWVLVPATMGFPGTPAHWELQPTDSEDG